MLNFIVFITCEKFSATMHVTKDKHGLDETFSFCFCLFASQVLVCGAGTCYGLQGRVGDTVSK